MLIEFNKINLPESWIWSTIGEIGLVIGGGTPSTRNNLFWGDDIPWVTPADLSNYFEMYISKGTRGISVEGLNYSSAKLLPKGTILFSSRAPIGYVAIAKNDIATNQGFKNLIITKSLSNEYVYYYLKSIKPLAEKMASGTTFLELSATKFSQLPFPLPPLNEQYRIVSKIEELFSELDYAEDGLRKAQTQLKVYRHSLLKSAFEGKLTKVWRNQNQTKSAFDVLKSIKENRKSKYVGHTENKGSKKLLADFDFEFSQNSEIESWADATLNNLIKINARIGWRGLKRDEYTKTGPLFLSVHSLNFGKNVVFKDANHISTYRYNESPEIKLEINDILLCKDGAGIGKVALVKQLPDSATVNSSLLVIRSREVFVPDFLYYFLLGPAMQKLVNEKISGSAIPHLFQKDIKKFRLKVPPIEEQRQIVQELESRFTLIENLKSTIKLGLQKIEIFRNSILNKAFKGELLIQSPDDEHASLLIKSIKIEKESYILSRNEADKLKPKIHRIMNESKTIIEILEEAGRPVLTKEVWQTSIHKLDIDAFYEQLKKHIENNEIFEIERQGKETFLNLASHNENR